MRVLMTTDTVGGVWTFTRELAGQLLAEGDDVTLVGFGDEPEAGQAAWVSATGARFAGQFRFVTSPAPLEWMQGNAECFAMGAERLQAEAQRLHPDVLHSNQFCWGALGLGCPVVVSAHSDVLSWAEACEPDGLPASAWLDQYRALVEQGLAGADAVIAPTGWMARAIQRHFTVRGAVQVIPNGRTLSPAEPGMRRLQAVSAGRLWDKAKGLEVLAGLDAAMPVVVAGENAFEGERAPHAPGVTWAGRLGEAALLRLFRESAIYIATSIYEPFGLAPLEAALCGCAVVARDLPSLREVWGGVALFFRDAAELDRLLRTLADDPAQLQAEQAAAYARAQSFSAARMAAGYQALYRSLAPAADTLAAAAQKEHAPHAA